MSESTITIQEKKQNKVNAMRAIIATILMIGLLLSFISCAPQNETKADSAVKGSQDAMMQAPAPEQKVETSSFSSAEELLAFIKENQQSLSYSGYGSGAIRQVAISTEAAVPTSAPAQDSMKSSTSGSNSAQSNDHSSTNNQVASVDEADIIKTDGNYIYTATGNTVFIIKAYPGEEAKVVSKINLKSQPQGLFVEGDKLSVIGNFYDTEYFRSIDYIPRSGMSFANIYDISDKQSPKLEHELKFEGSYLQARMLGSNVYLVVQSNPTYSIDYPTPVYFEGSAIKSVPVSNVRYLPIPYNSMVYTTAHSINIESGDIVDSESMLTDWTQTVYMSENNLYIASTLNINEWDIRQQATMDIVEPMLGAKDKATIEKIRNADIDILTPQEKKQKELQVINEYMQYKLNDSQRDDLNDKLDNETRTRLDEYDALTYTVISRLGLDGGKITLAATGKVPGTVNDQFALDEKDGILRVATTLRETRYWLKPMQAEGKSASSSIINPSVMPRWQTDSENNIYTLDSGMNIIGKLEGIAQGEQIYSTRFMDDRLYLVTFRQVDPFFVYDLSNPKNITQLGQLKVPGFSRYLHPYDKNTIIGIGQDATDSGRTKGLKISLFDVTNVSSPKEVAKFVASGEYSSSTAEYEHKAFLFSREKELLVIPAYSYDYQSYGNYGSYENYNGAMVFHITPSEITLRGIIDHSKGSQQYGAQVERSLWINDLLYTKSPNLLRINKLDDLSSVANVTLDESSGTPYKIY